MFHELIFALNGFAGDVFIYDGDNFKISKELLQTPLIHPSEFQIISDILDIATLYKKISEFIENHEQVSKSLQTQQGPNNKGPSGLFVSSVCKGLQEILDKYLRVVTKLELQILEDPYIPMTQLRAILEPFRPLFLLLCSLIMKIKAQIKSSAVIVEIVKWHFDMNISLQEDLKPLIPCVNRTLHEQITNWVVFGSLFDPHEEFFIQSKTVSGISEVDGSFKPPPPQNNTDRANDKFIVNFSVVPSHFPVPLTERILFVGYAIGILRNSEKTKMTLNSKQKEFSKKMNELSLNTFRIEELDDAIAELATAVGKDLHHLVVTETDLQKHLGIVKDFYLTGRGELFHDFLLNLKGISFSKNSLSSDVTQAFALAASRVQVQDEIIQRITISVDVSPDNKVKSLSSCIAHMSLGMENEWPLHVLFTQESIKKYNELFVFLLQVRRLQLDLHLLWMNTRKIFRFPIPDGPAELRNIMSYFIDHLQHFLQEDVLENQFAKLSEAVAKSDNFEQIRVAHATFQSNILNQSFRSSKQLSHFVDEIIVICNRFVRFINQHLELLDVKQIPINEGISDEILGYSNNFRRHMDLLLNILKGVAVNPIALSGQYLGQFLLRLDFNSYFSSIISGLDID